MDYFNTICNEQLDLMVELRNIMKVVTTMYEVPATYEFRRSKGDSIPKEKIFELCKCLIEKDWESTIEIFALCAF